MHVPYLMQTLHTVKQLTLLSFHGKNIMNKNCDVTNFDYRDASSKDIAVSDAKLAYTNNA